MKKQEKPHWQIRVQNFFNEELPVPTATAIAHQRKERKRNNARSGIIHKNEKFGITELDHESEFELPD
jgi:hypothetical protein